MNHFSVHNVPMYLLATEAPGGDHGLGYQVAGFAVGRTRSIAFFDQVQSSLSKLPDHFVVGLARLDQM